MAGHSKRHNIKHRKAAQDAKKSKILAQASKQIQMLAKNGADPSLNPSLAVAITKAKQVGLNKEAIQKAVDKGSGNLAGEELVEMFYEGYGPGGIAMFIKAITSNTNRSASSIKSTLVKYNGSMGAPGSVSWQFVEKGEIFIDGMSKVEIIKGKEVSTILPLGEDFELALMETSAEDYQIEEGIARVVTSKDDFIDTVQTLEQQGWHIDQSDLIFVAENTIALDATGEERLQRLIDALEEDEDVDTVWHNSG